MVGRVFTAGELAYLRSLDAVDRVDGSSRIYYADWFRVECMRRYQAGEKPTVLFREAGLDPRLVGHKRIERAFARWRYMERVLPQNKTRTPTPESEPELNPNPNPSPDSNPDSNPNSNSELDAEPGSVSGVASVSGVGAGGVVSAGDSRDCLIAAQALLIQQLEKEVQTLKHA